MFRVELLADGSNNLTAAVTGTLHAKLDFEEVLDLAKTKGGAGGRCRFESVTWVIQEKMRLLLWWNKENLIVPMESRNFLKTEAGLKPPEGWNGKFLLSSEALTAPPMHFLLILDFHR